MMRLNSGIDSQERPADGGRQIANLEALAREYVSKEVFTDLGILKEHREAIASGNADAILGVSERFQLKGKEKTVISNTTGFAKDHFEKAIASSTSPKKTAEDLREHLVREIVAKSATLDRQREQAVKTISNEYDLAPNQLARLEAATADVLPKQASDLLSEAGKRERFVWQVLGRNGAMPEKSTRFDQLSKLGMKKDGETADQENERKEKIALWQTAIMSGRLTDREAAEIIAEFQDPEDRKILVRAFVSNSDLGTLVEKGLVTESAALEAVKKTLSTKPEYLALDDDGKKAVIARVDLKEVPVNVDDLPEIALSGFVSHVALKGELAKKLAEEVKRWAVEIREDINGEFEVEAEADGTVARNFMRETRRRLTVQGAPGKGIANLGLLEDGEHLKELGIPVYVQGTCETANGDVKATMKIGPWKEFSTGDKKVAVTFYGEHFEESVSELDYPSFYKLLSRFKKGTAMDSETFSGIRRVSRTHEEIDTAEDAPFASLAELEDRIDSIDIDGKGQKIAKGLTLAFGKPENSSYAITTVLSVDESAVINEPVRLPDGSVGSRAENGVITTRDAFGRIEKFSYRKFFTLFSKGIYEGPDRNSTRTLLATRLKDDVSTPENVIERHKTGQNGKDYADLVVRRSEGSTKGRISVKNRQFEDGYEGVRYFYGPDGNGVEIEEIKIDGTIVMRPIEGFKLYDEEEAKEKGKTGKVDPIGEFQVRSAEYLHFMLSKYSCQPYTPARGFDDKPLQDVPFEKNSFLKAFMHAPSFNDILKGIARIPDVVKHRLEHSSKHHAAHVAHAFASWLPGFPEEWLVDFERELFSEDKKMLEEDIEHLAGLNPPKKRHQQIRTWLMDSASSHSEIIAGICSMLEKHGSLYVGVLKDLEGTWAFYQRLPGDKAAKENFLGFLEKRYEGREITEEFAIHEWLKMKAPELHLNPAYWKMVKDRWEKGADGEKGNGAKEVKNWPNFDRRLKYCLEKFEDGEYAHGIGAMEESWNKPGPLKDRMKLPFLLAFTNIRDNVHTSILQSLSSTFDAGHTYPPLLFAQDASRQKIFRNVIRKIAAKIAAKEDPDGRLETNCLKKFDSLAGMFVGGANNDLIKKSWAFWDQYGEEFTKILSLNPANPLIFLEKDNDPDFKDYYAIYGGELDDSKIDDAEISMGNYTAGRMNWAMGNVTKFVSLIRFSHGPGKIDGPLPSFLFNQLIDTFSMIRDEKYSEDATENENCKRKLFEHLHTALMKHMEKNLSPDLWKIDGDTGKQKLYNQEWMARLAKIGLRISPTQGAEISDSDAYAAWMEGDFQRFLRGEHAIAQVNERVAGSVGEIIDLPEPRNVRNNRQDRNGGRTPGADEASNAEETAEREGLPEIQENVEEPEIPAAPETPETPHVQETVETPSPTVEDEIGETEEAETETETVAEAPPTFREKYAPVVDRIVNRFGKWPSIYAVGRSREMTEALYKARVIVPENIRNSEWAYGKIVERFLELEPMNFFQGVEGENFVGNEFLRQDDVETEMGLAVLASLRKGHVPNTDHIASANTQMYLSMLFLDNQTWSNNWSPESIREVGKIFLNA